MNHPDLHIVRELNAWNTPPKFAEQHQVDPDDAYRDAIYDEIRDALRLLAWGVGSALLLVVGMVYYGNVM